jgi:RNA polymerase sigma-70 factor, ECF subfamily
VAVPANSQPGHPIDDRLVARLYHRAKADRWGLSVESFAGALVASLDRACARDVEACLGALHLEDLALACACADGCESAWEHFMRGHRTLLYRAADALDPGGGAREIADSLYAELYGLHRRDGERRTLFRYFHGRSSLATWLRSVLAQRWVDHVRARRHSEPLPDEHSTARLQARPAADPDRSRYVAAMDRALAAALDGLPSRDRLRLGCYYVQQLTLAETGRMLGEHEATVSRQLARTRRVIRRATERALSEAGLSGPEIDRCLASIVEDAGPLDLDRMLASFDPPVPRKMAAPDRSI